MIVLTTKRKSGLVTAAILYLTFAVTANGQVQSQTSSTQGAPTKEATVERGEVVYVSGNQLIVKMEDGQLKDILHVPETARVTVNGKQLGIHDLKPGMKLERTITTTTTPRTVTTVQSVEGKIWHITPPNSVTLTLNDGTNQTFTIPQGQKFNVDGQMMDAFGLKKGMKITATKVVESPETVISKQSHVTGTMPPPPPTPPPADIPILVVYVPQPKPSPPAAESAEAKLPAKLPQTASNTPFIGVLGLLCGFASLGVKLIRTKIA
jgi:hypothetical protein